MKEQIYHTPKGNIHYWINDCRIDKSCTLLFLPGLTADHRLFDKQLEYFEHCYNVFVWDAPGHAASWPFQLDFTLIDKAGWLQEIIELEHMEKPIIIGQSMGGYVGQAYMERLPSKLSGFISIDSAPLQRQYVTNMEIRLLKKMEPVYRHYPWKLLLHSGTNGCATSEYGRKLMRDIMMVYDGNQDRYAKLSGHGFQMLANAMEADLPYRIDCPALLICGDHDKAGSTKRYNKAWHKTSGIRLEWVKNAGHNSNTDNPEMVNSLIERFIKDNISEE